MNEHQNSFPNVNLKGKLQKQKGEVDASQQRYGQPHQTEYRNKKK
ncbi:hypothetical protein [Bacillus sp. MRMR6]|jgi:hypothetical protein|nr:hypothetical protein [Bacillus sp. MRMR6]